MNAWLRALIDGLACVGSFGQRCGERRVPQSDAEAVASDWRAVGDGLRAATAEWERSNRDAHEAIRDGAIRAWPRNR